MARQKSMLFCLAILFLLLSLPTLAWADDSWMRWSAEFSLEYNAGVFQEDVFANAQLQLYQRLRVPQLGRNLIEDDQARFQDTSIQLMVQAPLRFRLSDRGPVDALGLRQEDWDERRDIARVVRQLDYGEPGSPFHLHMGELNAVSVLDGALIEHFFNAVNPDSPAAGVLATSSTRVQDTSLMVDDVLRPSVVAAGARVRPFHGLKRDPLMRRLGVGAQVAADLRAPTELARDSEGFIEVDATSAPTVLESQPTLIAGPSVEFWIIARDNLSLLTHAEVFWHDRLGRGEHVGLSAQWRPNGLIAAQLRSSVIFAHDRYVPRYFSSLYQVEKFQIQGFDAELPATKLELVSQLSPRNDVYLANTLTLDLSRWNSQVMLDYLWARDTARADAATLSLRAQPFDVVALYLFYHQNFIGSARDLLELERSLIGSELRVMPFRRFPVYFAGRYDQRWRLRDDGRWRGVQDWNIGMGVQFGFGVN